MLFGPYQVVSTRWACWDVCVSLMGELAWCSLGNGPEAWLRVTCLPLTLGQMILQIPSLHTNLAVQSCVRSWGVLLDQKMNSTQQLSVFLQREASVPKKRTVAYPLTPLQTHSRRHNSLLDTALVSAPVS